jgi:VCBS repeat-containing protein
VYTVDVGSKETQGKLGDGVYTPIIKVTNKAGTSSANGEAFTVDTSTAQNQDSKKTPTVVPDENGVDAVQINVGSIDDGLNAGPNATTTSDGSKDTGGSKTDFITSDGTLTFQGKVTGFVANGDVVHIQVLDAAKKIVLDQYAAIDSNNTWSFNNQANTLAVGDYTISAYIEDKAGNVVKSATQPLTIASPNVLIAQSDAITVLENFDIAKTSVSAGVLANDGDTTASTLKVTQVAMGDLINDKPTFTQNASAVSGSKVLSGKYGQLELFDSGEYKYTQDPSKVDPLNAGEVVKDIFTYEVQAQSGVVALDRPQTLATLTIDIVGVNDSAVMQLINSQPIVMNDFTKQENSDPMLPPALSISDVDKNEAAIQGLAADGDTQAKGTLGLLVMTGYANSDGYGFSYTKTGSVVADTNQHDLFSFTSKDGTQNKTLDFVLNGDSTVTKQEFNVAPLGNEHTVTGITVTGSTSLAVTDTLVLHGSDSEKQLTTFDFSDPSNTSFKSIEKIEMKGTGPSVLKLTLADLTQTDSTNGVLSQQLIINGDGSDDIFFKTAVSAVDNGIKDGYHIYSFTSPGQATDELLIQTSIHSITFTS